MNILLNTTFDYTFSLDDGKRNESTTRNGKAERTKERSVRESSQSRGISGRVPARALCSQPRYFFMEKERGRWFATVKNCFPSFLLRRINRAARTANSRWREKKKRGAIWKGNILVKGFSFHPRCYSRGVISIPSSRQNSPSLRIICCRVYTFNVRVATFAT